MSTPLSGGQVLRPSSVRILAWARISLVCGGGELALEGFGGFSRAHATPCLSSISRSRRSALLTLIYNGRGGALQKVAFAPLSSGLGMPCSLQ